MSTGFLHQLARYGPDNAAAPVPLAQARAFCSRLARSHYENFSVATLLLPRPLIPHFHAVYAWCRWADDLGDETGGGDVALKLLRWWRDELHACYAGQPRHPITIALLPTVRTFGIPEQPFLDLISAFEQDQVVKQYDTTDQLFGYCRCSANPVGRLVLYLCRAFDDAKAELSDRVCSGLQLANFWQDVARDFAIGRVYLPREDRERFGYSDEDLHARRFNPAFATLLRHEVDETRTLLYGGFPLTEMVPPGLRGDIELFIRGGLAILDEIERAGYDVWKRRPVVSRWRKAALIGGALWRRTWLALTGNRR
jgi:squalene synthase HpnC